jgi:hypothetical protein
MSPDTLDSPLHGSRLGPLLAPRSIAILGASDKPSLSQAVLRSLGTLGYAGPVFPVNPKYERILDYACYASLDHLPETPDLVAFCIGSRHILANLELAAARKKVPKASPCNVPSRISARKPRSPFAARIAWVS